MSSENLAYPPIDTWVAAIHASEDDLTPLGTALVINTRRVLTCAHVVTSNHGVVHGSMWVAFPHADEASGRRASVVVADRASVVDLAVLILGEDVPTGVAAAPLRCPKPRDLVGRRWWAFGFAHSDPVGNCADEFVGASLGYGWIRLDAESRYYIEPGFSGGGLWSPDYEAVVAIVGKASAKGDGHAITLHQANLSLPGEKLSALSTWSAEAAGELALAAWGWTLARDPEAGRHWRPRARGVNNDSERGYLFRGRTAALTAIVNWLDRPDPDRRALLVTGSPGVGKSAVLGRIVTTADAAIRTALPPDDDFVRASVGSVACAVHAKAKTALDIAAEIARAASARLPDDIEDIGPALRDSLSERGGKRFNVIIDALDEAATAAEAKAIITKIILPLAETCSDVGAQIIVGCRRRDDLLGLFGGALAVIDLNDSRYFVEVDLLAYTMASLQLAGNERFGNPYTDDRVASALARSIAKLADRNFLVAGLIARTHGLHDRLAAEPEHLAFTANVDSALATYLERVSPIAEVSAETALTALAFAEAPGLPIDLWRRAIEAIGGNEVTADQLLQFARSSAANFLVESGADGPAAVFRLFHQTLNDTLLRARSQIVSRTDDEMALSQAFAELGRQSTWRHAPAYLLRSLATHAASADMIDDLLTDDTYLLHVDLRRLIPLADHATSMPARRRARLLHLTPEAITADPQRRTALFSITEALENLGHSYSSRGSTAPYRARWASVEPCTEHAVLPLPGYDWVSGLCALTLNGLVLLASAGADATVRIWDPVTGEQRARLEGHHGGVRGVCAFTLDGLVLLASAGADTTVRIWDPVTGEQRAWLEGHHGGVRGVCAFRLGGLVLLASASDDHTVRIWDPVTGEQRAWLEGHHGGVRGVCAFRLGGLVLLASASDDHTVRIWDPVTGEQRARLEGHHGWVRAVCAFTLDGLVLLASAGADATVRIWDPATGEQRARLEGHHGWVKGVCAFTLDGLVLLASASEDRTVRIWDPAAAVCLLTVPVHHPANAVDNVADSLVVALRAPTGGILAIELNSALWIQRTGLHETAMHHAWNPSGTVRVDGDRADPGQLIGSRRSGHGFAQI